MGIPEAWETVESWLNNKNIPSYPPLTDVKMAERKFPEIPILEDYSVAPDDSFWSKFPKRDLPKRASTRINVKNFRRIIASHESKLTATEKRRANRVLQDLTKGASACQKSRLPPLSTPNAKTALEHGALLTDKIAGWVTAGFVAGPFDTPPIPGFRANPLMAIVQHGKVRPVLNMSGPRGRSFNDNVDHNQLEKVHMDNAKRFGFFLREAGKGAVFSKFDYGDAYKTVPADPEDYSIQGFVWCGKYFVETQQTFGGIPSVCNFDREGNTIQVLATVESAVPKSSVLRILDDTSHIRPANSKQAGLFCAAMKRICGAINMPLAPNCPKLEKAFEESTRGVVMGIGFDSNNMSWFLPEAKADRVMRRCLDIYRSGMASLKQMEQVMGSINDLAQMASFLRFYKSNGNRFLQSFNGNYDILKVLPIQLRDDLLVAAKVANSARIGLPICERPGKPPLSTLLIHSDAAGASFSMVNGEKVYHNNEDRAVACVGGDCIDSLWAWSRLVWPVSLLTGRTDCDGKSFGSKSTFLESLGLMLPFLAFPTLLAGRHICFRVDNMAVVYGWQNGQVKFDKYASEVLRAVHLSACFLGCTVYVQHVPRMSSELAELSDTLSRKPSSSEVAGVTSFKASDSFTQWLEGDLNQREMSLQIFNLFKDGL